ncbi:MAG TPA: hypothetical protein VFY55_04090 [Nitrososphaeraceae archaeon]|nr:hypothetical protein [Nitrososphaeraceae archaeon]
MSIQEIKDGVRNLLIPRIVSQGYRSTTLPSAAKLRDSPSIDDRK